VIDDRENRASTASRVEPVPGEAMISRADHVISWLRRQRGVILFIITFTLLMSAVTYHHWDVIQVSEEAVVRSGIATDLLDGLTAGRRGLIGSLLWSPLPTILGLPFVYLLGLVSKGFDLPVLNTALAWPVLAAAASSFTVVLLNRWFRQSGLHWLIRYPLLIGYQLCPPILAAVLAGTSAPLLVLFAVAGLRFLHHWLVTLDVRSLAYVGTLAGLTMVTDWRTVVLVLVVLLVIIVRLLRAAPIKGFAQSALLVLLVPVVYLGVVWTLTNWLIMGNPFYFLKGLLAGASFMPNLWYGRLAWHLYVLAPVLLVLALLYGWLVARRGRLAWIPGVLLVLFMAVLVALPYYVELGTHWSYLEIYPQRVRTVDDIITFVEDRYPESRVVVCGYYGYLFRARAHNPELFVHFVDLSLPAVYHRTHGKELFLLLPRPEGMRTWENIYLNHPGLFTGYEDYTVGEGGFVSGFVFEERWPTADVETAPQWLLLRMILVEKKDGAS